MVAWQPNITNLLEKETGRRSRGSQIYYIKENPSQRVFSLA
jgi:hypothetical protein